MSVSEYFVHTNFGTPAKQPTTESPVPLIPGQAGPVEDLPVQPAGNLRVLLDALEKLPARRPVSLQVVSMVDDPDTSAGKLAGMVGADAALTARLLRLSNSAYYGLSGRVSSVQYAITVLGFSTVRAMALADAAGVQDGDVAPDGFWEHAAIVGVASAAAARWTGARAPEALCAGLLHDLGKVLLCRVDEEGYGELLRTYPDGPELLRAERRTYGMDHAAVAAQVLETWSLPEELVRPVRTHHDLLNASANPDERALAIGRVLAEAVQGKELDKEALRRASGGKVSAEQAEGVLVDLTTEARMLVQALTVAD